MAEYFQGIFFIGGRISSYSLQGSCSDFVCFQVFFLVLKISFCSHYLGGGRSEKKKNEERKRWMKICSGK
jgi:hypothetical protein